TKTVGGCLALAFACLVVQNLRAQRQPQAASQIRSIPRDVAAHKEYGTHFQTSDRCLACHNGVTTATGEDISIGVNWRTSIMANSARDPYWMAGVRRELIDHPA